MEKCKDGRRIRPIQHNKCPGAHITLHFETSVVQIWKCGWGTRVRIGALRRLAV